MFYNFSPLTWWIYILFSYFKMSFASPNTKPGNHWCLFIYCCLFIPPMTKMAKITGLTQSLISTKKAGTLPYSKIVISILSPCSAFRVSAIFSLLLFWLCSHAHNCALSKWLQLEFNLGKQDRKVVQLVSEHCVDVERKMSSLLFLALQGLRSFIWDFFPNMPQNVPILIPISVW